jgi:DNA-binding LacI/PurR family transcriptional regulator
MVAGHTATKIRAAALSMGYRPNPLLASLASKRFRSTKVVNGTPLAILTFPALPDGSGSRSVYQKILVSEAIKLGYAPKTYELTNGSDPVAVFRELYHRSTQGILIIGSMDMNTFGKGFDWEPFSVVQCARFHTVHSFHTVRANIFQAVKLAFTQLRSRGYRRIGFALGRHPQPMEDDQARHGAAIALEIAYLPARSRLPVYEGFFEDKEAFLAWYERWKPDAVVGFSVTQYWSLKDHGVNIPKDVGFVGLHLDGQERFDLYSGLFQNFQVIARQSVCLLDQMIRNGERGQSAEPYDLLIPSKWAEGKTVAPLGDVAKPTAKAAPSLSRPDRLGQRRSCSSS